VKKIGRDEIGGRKKFKPWGRGTVQKDNKVAGGKGIQEVKRGPRS